MAYAANPFITRSISNPFAPPRAVQEPSDDECADDGAGCGWFDSSFELKQGLEVRELAWTDPAAFMAA